MTQSLKKKHIRAKTARFSRGYKKKKTRLAHKPSCEIQLKQVYPQLRVFTLAPDVRKAILQKFQQCIPFSKRGDKTGKAGITYLELFRTLSGFDHTNQKPYLVLIKGGFVRDIVQGKSLNDIHDIDIVHTKPFNKVLYGTNGLQTLNIQYNQHKDKETNFYFLKIGADVSSNTNQSVDCTQLDLASFDYTHCEAPVNTLMLNVSVTPSQTQTDATMAQHIYDITGKGYEHAKHCVWDAPNPKVLRNTFWLSNAKLWRMIKFQLRGYTVSTTCKRHIYNYWLHHYHDVPVYNWINPWRKHFGAEGETLKQTVQNTRIALHNVLQIVCKDMEQLQMDVQDAKTFCIMLLEMNMLTVSSRLVDLKRMNQHYKLLRYSKGTPQSLASSVEQISKQNREIKELCAVLVSSPELNTHSSVFRYVERLTLTNLLTTFPVITFTNLHRHQMRQSNKTTPLQIASFRDYPKLLYSFPRYRKITHQQAVLCYPLHSKAARQLHNCMETMSVHQSSAKQKHKTISVRKAIQDMLSKLPSDTFCFVASNEDIRHIFTDDIVVFQEMHIIWYVSEKSLRTMHSKVDVCGKWNRNHTSLQLHPKLKWTFTSSIEDVTETHPVVYDSIHRCIVDWSGEQVLQWLTP